MVGGVGGVDGGGGANTRCTPPATPPPIAVSHNLDYVAICKMLEAGSDAQLLLLSAIDLDKCVLHMWPWQTVKEVLHHLHMMGILCEQDCIDVDSLDGRFGYMVGGGWLLRRGDLLRWLRPSRGW